MGNYSLFRSKYYLIVSLQCLSAMPGGTATNNEEVENGGSISVNDIPRANESDLGTDSSFRSSESENEPDNLVDSEADSSHGEESNVVETDSVFSGNAEFAMREIVAAEDFQKVIAPQAVDIDVSCTANMKAPVAAEDFQKFITPQAVDIASAGSVLQPFHGVADEFQKVITPQVVDIASAGSAFQPAHGVADEFQKVITPQVVDIASAGSALQPAHGVADEFQKESVSQSDLKSFDISAEKMEGIASNKTNVRNVELPKVSEAAPKIVLEADSNEDEGEVATGNIASATNYVKSKASNNWDESNSSIFTLGGMYSLPVASVDSMPIFVEGGIESDLELNGSAFVRSNIAISNVQVGVHLGVAIKSKFWNYENFRVTAIYSFDDIVNNSLPFSVKSGLEVSINGYLYWRVNLGYATFSLNLNNLYCSIKS